jgi:hypothetical protein
VSFPFELHLSRPAFGRQGLDEPRPGDGIAREDEEYVHGDAPGGMGGMGGMDT